MMYVYEICEKFCGWAKNMNWLSGVLLVAFVVPRSRDLIDWEARADRGCTVHTCTASCYVVSVLNTTLFCTLIAAWCYL